MGVALRRKVSQQVIQWSFSQKGDLILTDGPSDRPDYPKAH